MRRTLLLAGLAALGVVLVLLVRAPVRRTGPESVRGHRVFGVSARAVRGIDAVVEDRRFSARRVAGGWEIDGRQAGRATSEALDDLLEALVHLRAVDVFRPHDTASYGLDHPRATLELVTGRGVRRLVIGAANAGGSTFYARREGSPRIAQVGTLLLSDIERVFFTRDRTSAAANARYRPEIG